MTASTALLFLTGISSATPSTATDEPSPLVDSLSVNHQECSVDTDCVVAPALAGWAIAPPAGASCRAVCTVGISRRALAPWLALVKAKAHTVPCELEMEPCPPDEHFTPRCVAGICTVKYIGPQTP